MHIKPFRVSGARRHWLQFWVLLLLVPAGFALSTVPTTVAAVAVTLTFGLPLAFWLAIHVSNLRQFRAQLARGIRFGAGVSITCLGLVGLFLFSAVLALAAVASYVVTVGLARAWRSHAHTRTPSTHEKTPEVVEPVEPEAPTHRVVTADEVRKMTDAELCHAWRRSFVSLERARGVHVRAMLVQTRQLLLDEVEARHPEGLRAWLSSGARAAGGPDRFIGPDTGHPEAA